MRGYRGTWVVVLSVFLVCGCATPAYKDVFKDKPAYNAKSFALERDLLYQATLRAICGRNFIIEKEDEEKGVILAKRSFQRGKRTIVLVLQANASFDEAQRTTLFLNALETTERHYVADHTRFLLWLIPLPGGGGKEGASVKEGERIIEDKTFYQNFFVEIEEEAKRLASYKQDKEISVAAQAPQAEQAVIEEGPPRGVLSQDIIKEAVAPKITPGEAIADAAVLRPQGANSAKDFFQKILPPQVTLPAEKNVTDSSQ